MNKINDGAKVFPIGRGRDCKIHSGYRIIGQNTSDQSVSVWYASTLEEAMYSAASLAGENGGQQVDVVKYVCSVRPSIQVDVIKANDAGDDEVDNIVKKLKDRPA